MATKPKAEKFVPCVLRSLPEEELVAAATEACKINPANAPMLAMGLMGPVGDAVRAIADDALAIAVLTTKFWGPEGVRLTVTFKEKTNAELQAKIVSYANRWGERANVEFKLIDTTNWQNGDIRISRARGGYYAYLGTDNRQIARTDHTMNLEGFTLSTSESEYARVVVHEAGHVLGFPHEHARAAIVARLDVNKTIQYFQRTQGWSAQDVRQQVLIPLGEASIMATPADDDSIMTYQLPGSITKDGKPIRGGAVANESDLAFCARIYPRSNMLLTPPVGQPKRIRYMLESAAEITLSRLEET